MSHYSQNANTIEHRKNIKNCKRKMQIYEGKPIRITLALSTETLKARKVTRHDS
jgi:hypothetical protein